MSHERHAASSSASTSAAAEEKYPVDLAHLLAARDQELRALSAEMNQVQPELRLARNLIAERDSDIQRIRVTNNQEPRYKMASSQKLGHIRTDSEA